MLSIIHREHGDPAQVLSMRDVAPPVLPPDRVRVRVTTVPVHPGDLLGIMGSPAAGEPPPIGPNGRVPGFEGAGFVTEVGARVDPALGLETGMRVAFFPATAAWAEEVVAEPNAVVPLLNEVPDEVGAQMLINTVSALSVVRAAHDAVPQHARENVVTVLTAAGSAVGRIITKILLDRRVTPVRLVRSETSARVLAESLPGAPVVATEAPDWKDRVRAAIAGRAVHVAIDSVGGRLLGDLAGFVAHGGTVVNFGSLGGETSDIRLFPPRALTLKGVFMGNWTHLAPEQREQDVSLALSLAREAGGVFPVGHSFPARDVVRAVTHVGRSGRSGVVLLRFEQDQRVKR